MKAFKKEIDLTNTLIQSKSLIKDLGYFNWYPWCISEMDGLFGIPDLIVAFGKLSCKGRRFIRTFAFELKRFDWKRALMQAFRYKAFVNYSYVVIDDYYVSRAIKKIYLFERANIGLLSINQSGVISWHLKCKFDQPYSHYLRKEMFSKVPDRIFNHINLQEYNKPTTLNDIL